MCFMRQPDIRPAAAPIIAGTANQEANRQADIEAALRRRRAGAAANVLTAPGGIPSTLRLGQPA